MLVIFIKKLYCICSKIRIPFQKNNYLNHSNTEKKSKVLSSSYSPVNKQVMPRSKDVAWFDVCETKHSLILSELPSFSYSHINPMSINSNSCSPMKLTLFLESKKKIQSNEN